MNKRNIIPAAIVLIAILVLVVLERGQKSNQRISTITSLASNATSQASLLGKAGFSTTSSQVATSPRADTNQVPPSGASEVEKWKWLAEMERKDRYFEYKAPISFYGRVVDDMGAAINGVTVELSWTDASQPTGNSTRTVISDESGYFSITGIHGKALLVMNLTKPGYTKFLTQNVFSFNYGWFHDSYYHTPDPMNPVVFVMRRDRQGEALIVRGRQEAKLEKGTQVRSFPIGAGDVYVSVERLPDQTTNARYWNARVTVPDGGLLLTTDEFPYEAPEAGYATEYVITNGMSVMGNQGGMFYVKTPKGFGRVMVYYIPNMPWVYVESWFNPNPMSRNLELDRARVINLH